MAAAGFSEIDARIAAFVLMEASGRPVAQLWAALLPYLPRREARRRRPTWSTVHDRLSDLLLSAYLLDQAGEASPRHDTTRLLIVFQGAHSCAPMA
ncbi:hypothetical protein [Azospirillum picis]|uniref:Transposase n=1 Tax=Azospirillum picis TaxID=488438 RepID=A0ABU0MVE1_9PROT|nr:hypothetical protein [Azospirillum picis]MBP2303307.1 hypothetical protein [Azospirillum picis]MDQ0537153.1 hypothetical protein [Azospirillum picis]